MIKVIRPRRRKTVECPYCEALLSYEKEDIKRGADKTLNESGFGRVYDYYRYIVCPECGEEIRVEVIQ